MTIESIGYKLHTHSRIHTQIDTLPDPTFKQSSQSNDTSRDAIATPSSTT
ncbi:hypothetical protein HMPREF9997_00042 [Corynebacterium durum F0235]|uniref:Uncharacterized protein n=1 Tax=Corynebacterium durum F0235 TaxID=1035195 RepID=L1MMB2_9CORY|nr:hypothetical protein HMPREF9997_00042 [Corynebacterium durum F0235]